MGIIIEYYRTKHYYLKLKLYKFPRGVFGLQMDCKLNINNWIYNDVWASSVGGANTWDLSIDPNQVLGTIWDDQLIKDELIISLTIKITNVYVKKEWTKHGRAVDVDRKEWIKYNIL